jgi:hypothetical protein
LKPNINTVSGSFSNEEVFEIGTFPAALQYGDLIECRSVAMGFMAFGLHQLRTG